MVGREEVEFSRALVLKAQKRLSYQREVIAKLGFSANPQYEGVVRDVCKTLQARVEILTRQHRQLTSK